MKLNEQEMYFLLSECLKQSLTEADILNKQRKNIKKNAPRSYEIDNGNVNLRKNYSWDGEKFNEYWEENPDGENTPTDSTGKWNHNFLKRSKAGKALGTIAGTMVLSGILGGLVGGDLGALLGNLGMYGGIAYSVGMAAKSLRRYSLLKNMKVPNNPQMAYQVAVLAAQERAELQLQCKNAQANLRNSMAAYNMIYAGKNSPESILTFDKIKGLTSNAKNFDLLNAEMIAGEGEKGNVNFTTDFNNLNVTEGKINEGINNTDFSSTIVPVSTFKENFEVEEYEYDQIEYKQKLAVETVVGIAKFYSELYRLWYSWTRYIQILVQAFPEDLKWDDIIKNTGKKDANGLFNNLYHLILPNMAKMTDSLTKDSKQERGERILNSKENFKMHTLKITNASQEIKNDYGNKRKYVILSDLNDGQQYAIDVTNFSDTSFFEDGKQLNVSRFKQCVYNDRTIEWDGNTATLINYRQFYNNINN